MKVSLFVTCLTDQFFPQTGLAAANLLQRAGAKISFDYEQTCCGQIAFNSGYFREAQRIALKTIKILKKELAHADFIVIPSGSCTAMIKKLYAQIFADDEKILLEILDISERIFEFSEFLVKVLNVADVGAKFYGKVAYHEGCHLLHHLKVASEPRKLIEAVKGAELVELEYASTCCGFGGTFSVKYSEISTAIGHQKINGILQSGADIVTSCDSSCLLQIGGLLQRRTPVIRCLHLAELLNLNEV